MLGINNGNTINTYNYPSIDRYYKENENNDKYIKDNLDYLKYRVSLVTGDTVNIIFINDIHINSNRSFEAENQYPYNTYNGNWVYHNLNNYQHDNTSDKLERAFHLIKLLSKQIRIDCIILGGDYLLQGLTSDYKSSSFSRELCIKYFKNINTTIKKVAMNIPVFVIRGNHDSNFFGTDYDEALTKFCSIEDYSVISEGLPEYKGVVYGERTVVDQNGNTIRKKYKDFGYYDIERAKTRIIWLDDWDFNLSTETKSLTFGPYYRQEQLEFLINQALDLKDKSNWKIFIFKHHDFGTSEGFGLNTSNMLTKIFMSFREGLTGSVTWTPGVEDLNINVSWNFSWNKSANNKVIALVHGHTHSARRSITYWYSLNNNIIESPGNSTKGFSWISGAAFNSPSSFHFRDDGRHSADGHGGVSYVGKRESCFDILQYKLSDNTIYTQRYGCGVSKIYTMGSRGNYDPSFKNYTINVKDISGNAIQNAKVILRYNGEDIKNNPLGTSMSDFKDNPNAAYTDSKGQFTFKKVYFDKCIVIVSCNGYKTKEVEDTNINSITIDVILEKDNNYIPPATSTDSINNYNELESISASGAYIDTGIKISDCNNIQINTEFKVNATGEQGILGSINRGSVDGNSNGLRLWQDSSDDIVYLMSSTRKVTVINKGSDFVKFDLYIGDGSIFYYVNGTRYSSTGSNLTNCNKNLLLFAEYLGTLLETGQVTIKATQIKVDNVLVRDYVPVERKTDGEIGMYDKVNNKFYGSVNSYKFIK